MGGVVAGAGAMGLKELLKMLAVSAGSDIVAGLGESLRGTSPFEQTMERQAGYANAMLPDIYNEARGLPSMATRNLMRESNAGINREEQSFMASQTRANPNMTKLSAPTRTGTTRFSQARQEANRNILGQAQGNARQQLLGMGQNANAMIGLAEQRREQRRSEFNTNIMAFLGFYKGVNDPALKGRFDNMFSLIKQLYGNVASPTNTGFARNPTEYEPKY